jgi:hypothetical protein
MARCSGEFILPVQFFAAPTVSPERRLLRAVLEDGLHVIRRQAASPRLRARRVFRETVAWLASDDVSWPFSFVNACHVLGIDPDWVRARMRPYTEEPAAAAPVVASSSAVPERAVG